MNPLPNEIRRRTATICSFDGGGRFACRYRTLLLPNRAATEPRRVRAPFVVSICWNLSFEANTSRTRTSPGRPDVPQVASRPSPARVHSIDADGSLRCRRRVGDVCKPDSAPAASIPGGCESPVGRHHSEKGGQCGGSQSMEALDTRIFSNSAQRVSRRLAVRRSAQERCIGNVSGDSAIAATFIATRGQAVSSIHILIRACFTTDTPLAAYQWTGGQPLAVSMTMSKLTQWSRCLPRTVQTNQPGDQRRPYPATPITDRVS